MLVMKLHEGEVGNMKAVKAVYENGQLKLSEPAPEDGPVEVLVLFPENGDEAWEKIENEPAMRPAFAKFMEKKMVSVHSSLTTPNTTRFLPWKPGFSPARTRFPRQKPG